MTEISKEYAAALYALAAETGKEETVARELSRAREIFREEPRLVKLLDSPAIYKKDRVDVIGKVFGDFDGLVRSFLGFLCEKGDADKVNDCLEEYERLYTDGAGIADADVVSAVELSAEEKEKLCRKLEEKYGVRVRGHFTVDPALLGGVTVTVDGKVLDGSLRTRLRRLSDEIRSRSDRGKEEIQ